MSLKKILFTVSLLGSSLTAYLFLKYTNSCDCLSSLVFCDISSPDLLADAGKWIILRSLFAKIALFLFVHAFIIMSIRIVLKKSSPATQEDPQSIKVINRIISNTIEQYIIFVGLYAYFLFEKAGDRFNSNELLSFASWFIIGRVLFSVGYLVGSLLGAPVMRAFGFSLNLMTTIILFQDLFNDILFWKMISKTIKPTFQSIVCQYYSLPI